MGVYYPQCRVILKTVFDGFGGGDTNPLVSDVLPKSATIVLNGYKEADTFDIEFDARALPFTPEQVKQMAVEVYLFQTDGMASDPKRFATDSLTDDKRKNFTNAANLVLSGIVDDIAFKAGDDGRTFHISGRDYTCLLIGKLWPVDARIPAGSLIEDVVQDLVDKAVQKDTHGGQTLQVEFLDVSEDVRTGGESKALTQKVVTTKSKTTVGTGHGHTKKRGFPVKSGQTYWDVIYGLCLAHGFIAYVSGNSVKIGTPKVLTQERADDAVRVAYGRNLKELSIDRHMGREQVPQIVATCYDPDTRKQITAKWPENPEAQVRGDKSKGGLAAELTGVGTIREQLLRVSPPASITTEDELRKYVRGYYEYKTRSEAKYKFSTKALRDLTTDDARFPNGQDLVTGLRIATPVRIGFDDLNNEEMRGLGAAEREARMLELGYSRDVAQLVASKYDEVKRIKMPYYTRQVTFTWSNNDGLSLEVEAVNYVSAKRDDV